MADAIKRASLTKNPVFRGLSEAETEYALEFFRAAAASYENGGIIKNAGEAMTRFGLVLAGEVQVCADDVDGARMIMATVSEGETFGESLCYNEVKEIPVYILAAPNTSVLWLSLDGVRNLNPASDPRNFYLSRRFVSMLAERTLLMNDRIQILSKATLRDKLLTYFTQCVRRCGGKTFSLPFSREDMALYLGVNRSALSRELSKMRREGIIDFYRTSFKILH